MSSIPNPASYLIEVSGWDTDENFFVERSELEWREHNKRVSLCHPVREGALVFVRLLGTPAATNSNPVAFEVIQIDQATETPRHAYAISLRQVRPRMSASRFSETQKEEVR